MSKFCDFGSSFIDFLHRGNFLGEDEDTQNAKLKSRHCQPRYKIMRIEMTKKEAKGS